MNKLNLEVGRGNGFNEQNRFSLKFDIKNFDTTSVPLSALRITSYAWLQERNILGQFTSGVNSQGLLSQFTSAIDIKNGVGQTGIVYLDLSSTTYRVNHNVVDSSKIAPQLTINAPNGQSSQISPLAYANNTDTYFDIILDDAPPVPGYTITWFLPGSYESYTGSPTPVSNPIISIQKISEYIRSNKKRYDTKIVISWPGNVSNIPTNWGVKDTDVYVQITPNLYPSSYVTSSWYSSPDISLGDNAYFILEQFDGVNWNIVSEYSDFNILDQQTGISATDPYYLKIINDGSGNNTSVYIATSGSNPIAGTYSDKDYISLWSKGSADNRRRSLIKFDTSTLPSSATGIKNSILRLNVNSLSNAWNYNSTNGHIAVYRTSAEWTENEVTWSNRKAGIPWTVSGGDYVDVPAKWVGNSTLSNSFTSADQDNQFWLDFDVTDIVNYWRVNPSQNYGFLIKLYDSSNENNASDIKWQLNSGRLAGSGTISAYPQLLISYNVLNTSGATPLVQISVPTNNTNIFDSTFSLTGITSISAGTVESVSAYYRQSSSITSYIYFGTLNEISQNNWSNTFSSLSVGSYDFILRGVSDLGNYGESVPVTISFSNPPTISATSDSICHSGNIKIEGSVNISNEQPISGEISYSKQYIPNDKKITCIIEDKLNADIIWVGTEGNGLYRIDKSSIVTRVVNFNTNNCNISYNSISDISMESNGNLWISYTGNGLGLFYSNNWQNSNSNDWYLYNSSNSSLSAYPSNTIDICDIFIDSNDVKYLALTWNSIDSVISLSGTTFNDSYITKYNIGIFPRKLYVKNNVIYVGTSDNRIFKYNGTWLNYSLPTYQNINGISIDSNDIAWIATDLGIATLSGTTITECPTSSTPDWHSGSTLKNVEAKGIFIDSYDNKFISYSTGNNNEYNGGLVEYTGSNLDTSSTNGNNWSIIDTYFNSGLLSNVVYKSLRSTDGGLWIVTENGLCNYRMAIWDNFSNDNLKYPLIINGDYWYTNVQSPIFGHTKFDIVFNYQNSVSYTSSFYLDIEQTPSIQIIYPNKNFLTIPSYSSQKILEYKIAPNDVINGNTVDVNIEKSPNTDGPWYSVLNPTNSLNQVYKDVLSPEDFYCIRVTTSNINCSSESNVFSVYGNNISTVYIDPIVGNYTTKDSISYYGRVVNKDFGRQLNVNGNVYIDSLDSVVFGYTSGLNFITVGNATLGTVTNTSAEFNFVWVSPIAGITQLSAITTTKFGTSANGFVNFNSIISSPTITIINPITNDYLALNSPRILSASTQSILASVSALNYYISGNSSILISSATSGVGSIWTTSFTPSAYLSTGNYNIYATCMDISGTSAKSSYVPITINSLPTWIQVSNTSATHTGTYTYQSKIQDANSFYNNKVEILSASSIIYTGYANGFGDFVWYWLNPPNGNISLSAKIYDGRPSTSSDYNIVPIELNLNVATISLPSFNYPSAIKDGLTISPKVNVITTDTIVNLSANTTGTNISIINYWLCNYDENTNSYYKQTLLTSALVNPYSTSATLPSSRYYYSSSVSKYKFWALLAELVSDNNSKIESDLSYFYVKEQTISGDIENNCSDPIVFSGKFLDSDVPTSRTNTIIDNSVSAIIYDVTNSVILGTLTSGSRDNESVLFQYSWSNPSSATSAVNLIVQDSYNLSAYQYINYGGLDPSPTISLISSTNYIAYSSAAKLYVVSAGTISVSSTTSATEIKKVEYLISDSTQSYLTSADNNLVGSFYISASSNLTSINSYIQTSGNCVAYSVPNFYLTIQNISGNIYPDNCSQCYCNGGSLNIVGNFVDKNLSNQYLKNVFNYSISAYVYDNFNNLIQDITSQIIDGENQSWTTTWTSPTIGATLVYVKVIDNIGNIQYISKNLYRSIFESPQILLTSPVTYSTPNTIYKQSDIIPFISNTSSTNITVKYYSNGNLIGISNNPSNNYEFNWSVDKLPGIYSVSAIAINDTGCFSVDSKQIMVSNLPIVNILNPINEKYYQQNSIINVNVDAKGNNSIISAVDVLYSPGSLISATYDNSNNYWTSTLLPLDQSVSAYYISAIAYDTLGQSNLKSIKIYTTKNSNFNVNVSGTSVITDTSIIWNDIDTSDYWIRIYNGPNNDIYAITDGNAHVGKIYRGNINTSGITFTDTNAPNKNWSGFVTGPDGNVYASVFGDSIYQGFISNGTINWTDTGAGVKDWLNMTIGSDNKIYAVVNYLGSIYQGTISGTSVNWVDTNAPLITWDSIVNGPDGKLYATVYGGTSASIYQGTISGTSVNWIDTGAGNRFWKQIIVGPDNNLYATVYGGLIYKGVISGASVNWTSTGSGNKTWFPITVGSDNNLYAGAVSDSIYKGLISGASVNWSDIGSGVDNWYSIINGSDNNLYAASYNNIYKGDLHNYNVSANYNVILNISVSGSSNNGGYLSAAYLEISGEKIYLNNISLNNFSIPLLASKYFKQNSHNQIIIYIVDNFGAISSRTINIYIYPFSGLISYPVIRNLISNPSSKVAYR